MGYEQIRIIGKNLRDTPTYNGVNKIEKDDFLTCLRDIGLFLPKAANEKLVQYYDKDIDGYVYFVEFLKELRGEPNNERQLIIDEAFKKFEKDNSNMIDIRDLKGVFNASKHPKVISGEITQEQAFDELVEISMIILVLEKLKKVNGMIIMLLLVLLLMMINISFPYLNPLGKLLKFIIYLINLNFFNSK